MSNLKKCTSIKMKLIREGQISQKTFERVKIAKSYIEKKYKMKLAKELEKKKGSYNFIQNGILLIEN